MPSANTAIIVAVIAGVFGMISYAVYAVIRSKRAHRPEFDKARLKAYSDLFLELSEVYGKLAEVNWAVDDEKRWRLSEELDTPVGETARSLTAKRFIISPDAGSLADKLLASAILGDKRPPKELVEKRFAEVQELHQRITKQAQRDTAQGPTVSGDQ